MDTGRIRNIGIAAHIDAGKTTVSERLLYYSGVEHKIGAVDEGTATMDWMPQERERGITITAAATTLPWKDCGINLIDTPGHVDFTVEVERSLRVLDGAVLVIDAVAGVQAQSEAVWRQMRRHHVPAIGFVNKCDRAGADFLGALRSIERRLGARPIALQYPLLEGGRFIGYVDLLTRRAFDCSGREHAPHEPAHEVPLPAQLADEVGVLRSELLDTLAEHDDALLSAVLEEREVDVALARATLRKLTIASAILPVLCGAALRNIGIEPLLDAVVDLLPSPLEVPPITGLDPATHERVTRPPLADAPVAALAFKLHAEPHGDVTYVRIYSGHIAPGTALFNPRTNKHERIGRLLRVHADSRTQLDIAGPGEIVALTGLKATSTGDTLCSSDARIVLESLVWPEPVISMVVEPRSTLDRERLRHALERLAREDPTFHQREDEATGQWLISGMGELHLEVMLQRLKTEAHVDAAMGQPRVAYREALCSSSRGSGRVERAIGGKEVFGAVDVEVAPGSGLEVVWAEGCLVPREFRAAVQESLLVAAQVGPRFGFPLVDARMTLSGGESHPRLDAEVGFVQAAASALRAAMNSAVIDLLEPRMDFEITAPSEFSSGIIADLNSRHADVERVVSQETWRLISGKVALIHMFGYASAVRSLSQGRASYSMHPAGFQVVPPDQLVARGLTWSR
jgi:elongation factor G